MLPTDRLFSWISVKKMQKPASVPRRKRKPQRPEEDNVRRRKKKKKTSEENARGNQFFHQPRREVQSDGEGRFSVCAESSRRGDFDSGIISYSFADVSKKFSYRTVQV